jgi:hypothetical protein
VAKFKYLETMVTSHDENIQSYNLTVLYGSKTWSLKLRDEHTLNMLENKVLRRMFETERGEVTGGWRKLHNGKLHNLYSLLNIRKSRSMRLVRHVVCMEDMHKKFQLESLK